MTFMQQTVLLVCLLLLCLKSHLYASWFFNQHLDYTGNKLSSIGFKCIINLSLISCRSCLFFCQSGPESFSTEWTNKKQLTIQQNNPTLSQIVLTWDKASVKSSKSIWKLQVFSYQTENLLWNQQEVSSLIHCVFHGQHLRFQFTNSSSLPIPMVLGRRKQRCI